MVSYSEEEIKNLVKIIQCLYKIELESKKLTEKEKKDNEIKMGDIYY